MIGLPGVASGSTQHLAVDAPATRSSDRPPFLPVPGLSVYSTTRREREGGGERVLSSRWISIPPATQTTALLPYYSRVRISIRA